MAFYLRLTVCEPLRFEPERLTVSQKEVGYAQE